MDKFIDLSISMDLNIVIKVPLPKFVNNVEKKVSHGKNIIPNFDVNTTLNDYLNGIFLNKYHLRNKEEMIYNNE